MRRFAAAVLAAAALAGAARGEDLSPLFPRPQEVLGWTAKSDVRQFAGEAIIQWKGEDAQILLDYNIRSAAEAVYAGPGEALLTLEVYELASVADAYGLFSYLRSGAEVRKVDVPQEGYVAGGSGALWKDVFCAVVTETAESPAAREAVEAFLKAVSKRVPEETALPDIFRALETVGFVQGSHSYLHTDLALKKVHYVADDNVLKLSAETEMVIGRFLIDGREFEAFLAVYPSDEAAVAAAASYAVFLGKNPDAEAAWFKQWGRAIAGIWTGLKVPETVDSEYMMFDTIQELMRQVRIFQLYK